ncbi:butyrate kinase [Oceanotoga sp. DSM 15011]|uniref:butyrate kinase n=1 Tax=Oceanotoga sp. DSM 15011 TaxID=2984951 RepID=UPI0021F44293|nr:butyrate kinase [Oceanotoga sp. DSM 15011]UYP00966.1 butyrate kinase [Oceanotoga sp. DSM 15011]
MYKILTINPGSTSTKVAVFEDEKMISSETIEHKSSELKKHENIMDQIGFRKEAILKFLDKNGLKINDIHSIAARGGILPPLKSGTYLVNEDMVHYLKFETKTEHASNLAAVIGYELSDNKIPVYVTDPVSVDEFCEEARVSGIKELKRKSLLHALNMKIVARKASEEIGKEYNSCNFVIAHLGGGISVGAQKKGKMIDVNNANDEGPFSPERAGELPMGDLLKIIFSDLYNHKELKKRLIGHGGLVGYLGTNDLREAFKMAQKDEKAELVIEAMAYQIAKEIGAMTVVLNGEVDAIIITGGLANSEPFINLIKERVSKLGLIMVYPGSFEMEALALGAFRILNNSESPLNWSKEV